MSKQTIAGMLLAVGLALATTAPSQALLGIARNDNAAAPNANSSHTANPTTDEQSKQNQPDGQQGHVLDATRQQDLDLKRLQIKQRLEQRKAAVGDKLTGQRAEACEAKEIRINQILKNRQEAAARHLETFRAIQTRLTDFVTAQNLTIESSGAYLNSLELAYDHAYVFIDETNKPDLFACENASESQPGVIVMGLMADTKQALKDYREAIRLYAEAVRTAAEQQTVTSEGDKSIDSSSEEGTTEEVTR